ncbi:hypothetical protein HMPREF9554_02005 [Treponema phagedenis F0421]|nr:hypothetical protein HMPREF9554_02005 [Treponema phagedenis F0421]
MSKQALASSHSKPTVKLFLRAKTFYLKNKNACFIALKSVY